jgi:hypothetical protein
MRYKRKRRVSRKWECLPCHSSAWLLVRLNTCHLVYKHGNFTSGSAAVAEESRRFPPPWTEHAESFWVQDASGQTGVVLLPSP